MQLKCQHPCNLKCHPLRTAPNKPDVHETMLCEVPFSETCPAGTHQLTWRCHQQRPAKCICCEKEAKRLEKQAQEDILIQAKRQNDEREHDLQMLELDAKLQSAKEALADIQKDKDRENEARQKEKEIEDLKEKARKAKLKAAAKAKKSSKPAADSSKPSQNQPAAPRPEVPSAARDKWEHQKRTEGAENEAIDQIMDMTGLEDVKDQILRIKSKIDTMKRQGVAINKERLNLVLLGNPGTGLFLSPACSSNATDEHEMK